MKQRAEERNKRVYEGGLYFLLEYPDEVWPIPNLRLTPLVLRGTEVPSLLTFTIGAIGDTTVLGVGVASEGGFRKDIKVPCLETGRPLALLVDTGLDPALEEGLDGILCVGAVFTMDDPVEVDGVR